MKKKNFIVIAIVVIILVIGFAAVCTTLLTNGLVSIGANKNDFEVIFTNAKLNNVERKDFISENKKVINFETDKMTLVGEVAELEYEVTNASTQYDAHIKISCNLVENESDSFDNSTIAMEYEPTAMVVRSGKTKTGIVTVKLLKPVVEDYDINLKCNLEATAREKSLTDEETSVDVLSGDGTQVGDEVCIDNECFYVLSNDGYDMRLLSKYNLYVGDIYGSSSVLIEEISTDDARYGKQNKEAKGGLWRNDASKAPFYGLTDFSEGTVDYSNSLVKKYVDEYVLYLSNNYGLDLVGDILSKKDIETIVGGKLSQGSINGSYSTYEWPEWLYSTSYWTKTIGSGSYMWGVFSDGYFYYNSTPAVSNYYHYLGVRPVIEVKIKEKDENYVKPVKLGGTMNTRSNISAFDQYATSVTKIVFEDTLTEHETSQSMIFDISSSTDDKVMAYFVSNNSGYTLYINSDGVVVANDNCSGLFSGFKYLTEIEGLENFDTSNVTNMSGMFYGCSTLDNVYLKQLNTSNVTDATGMFNGCTSLVSLEMGNLNKLTNMSGMFYNCSSLISIELGDMDSLVSSNGMFGNFTSLVSVKIGNLSNLEDMSSMFYGCTKLQTVDLSKSSLGNVKNMIGTFSGCTSLKELDFSMLDTSNVTDTSGLFSGCTSLSSIKLGSLSKLTTISSMFNNCKALSSIELGDMNSLTSASGLFSGFNSLVSVKLGNLTNLVDMSGMFSGCTSLKELDFSMSDTSNVTNMSATFAGCTSLTSVKLGNLSKVENFSNMFASCNKLETVDLKQSNSNSAQNISAMFGGCSSLIDLDMSNFDTSNVTNMSGLFSGCTSLRNLDISGFTINDSTSTSSMFGGVPDDVQILVRDSLTQEKVLSSASSSWTVDNVIIKA